MGKALWAKNEGDTMNIDFGAKFKKFRKEKGMSIAMLAEKAGVSPGMISQIERNTTVPSIYVFWKLCNALGEKVSVFFEEEEERDKVTLVRAGEHRMVSGSGNQYYLLTPDPKRRIEMYKVVFPPGRGAGACAGIPRGGGVRLHHLRHAAGDHRDRRVCALPGRQHLL